MIRSTAHVPLAARNWRVPREWGILDDLCEGVFDCPHTTPTLTDFGPFVARSQDVRSGIFRLDEAAHVSQATYRERISRAEPRYGDLLYSREGTYFGHAAEVPAGQQVCLGQRMVLIRPRRQQLNHRFLRYWLNSPVLTDHVQGFRDGTVAERLNMPTIRSIPVPLMLLSEQEAIAELLGSLDDKIELNRRMNETLEAMAQAIFRDWFVDFGPVRRKMEGATDPVAIMGGVTTDAERTAELAALFAAELSPEGQPTGWDWGTAGDWIDFNPAEPLRKGASAPYLEMSALPTSGPTADAPVERPFGSGMRFRNGDALLARITPCLENGKACFVDGLPEGVVGWGSTEFFVLRARAPAPKATGYLLCRDPDFRSRAMQSMTGTSGRQRAQLDILRAWPIAIPPEPVLRAFAAFIDPLFGKIKANAAESRTLAETRDYLLPRLMSGEVRVREAEELAEAAE